MRSVLFQQSFSFYLQWPWLKLGFYVLYFFFIQLSNNAEPSFDRWLVNTIVFFVAMGIIEINIYSLQLSFEKHYKKAFLIMGGIYVALGTASYYVLHTSQNVVSTEIWNREVEVSWKMYIANFSKFYWTFFKYAVILTLVKQILLWRTTIKEKTWSPIPSFKINETLPVYSSQTVSSHDRDGQNVRSSLADFANPFGELLENNSILKFKAGVVTYMLDIATIVYLEVHDEITTIYRIDGSRVEVKISLSKFCEWLPENRFVRIHESRAVALPYIFREEKGHIYMLSYEDRSLKLGSQEKYPLYKKWKEYNLQK